MRIILIDDEPLARSVVLEYLHQWPEIEVIQECNDGFEGVKAIAQHSPDLIFLDIQMPKINGFEMLELIEQPPSVIFTTAFDEYAIKAFEINSVDYLLKPIGIEELRRAIEKFKKLNGLNQALILENISNAYQGINKQYKNRFMVKIGDSISSIKSEEILHFISEDGLVLISTNKGKRYTIDYTLDNLETLISPEVFFRINRKVIVNINSVQKVSSYFNSRLKLNTEALSDDDSVVSRERVNDFKLWLDK